MDAQSDSVESPMLNMNKRKRNTFTIVFLCIFFSLIITLELATVWSLTLTYGGNKNITCSDAVQHTSQSPPVTREYEEELNTPNGTLCVRFKQFKLSDSKRLTVCYYDGIRIDVRRFVGNTPSIQGIWITLQEWNKFVRYFASIQHTVIYFNRKPVV